MPAITLIVNPNGSVSVGIVRTPGPNPTLDGVVVRPTPHESSPDTSGAQGVVKEPQKNIFEPSTSDEATNT
jgi:hypothetical protein